MNHLIPRTTAILLHAAFNWLLLNWLMSYDLTGSWIVFAGFASLILVLILVFSLHIINYFYFLKTRAK